MSIDSLFDHTCCLYHAIETSEALGYGIADNVSLSYPDEPDIASLPCHFGLSTGNFAVYQGEPRKELDGRLKLSVPYGTDIRLNDKIIDEQSGMAYTAEIPRTIRTNHIAVWVKPEGTQGAL